MNKPYVLVKKYCANHLDDGTCVGTNFKPETGEHFRFLPEGTRCLIACGQRCKYFDWAVLPMKNWDWEKPKTNILSNDKLPKGNTINPKEGKEFMEGQDRYRRKHSGLPGLAIRQRRCPECRTIIGPRMRYCMDCAGKHRTQTYRDSKRKSRSNVHS